MTGAEELFNPFPGLRPFGSEEGHLFFGREQIVDQLLMRLRESRFLAVVGRSGSGKSSIVRAGLIPSLHSGFMSSAGSSWRVAVMRPGNDPIGNLAEAVSHPDVLGYQPGTDEESPMLTEVTLRRSNLGLIDCVDMARLPPEDNVLIVVDQFEELFRFKRSDQADDARDEAIGFVKRLLGAASQQDLPIYIVITMRSGFIGECSDYPGLPEAVNGGQFLVPGMNREMLRAAIEGPMLVAGGEIAPRLLVRLLNEIGDDQDRLPILQHALMRTWNYWQAHAEIDEPVDIPHYEAIGTMEHALSSHADEAYEELESERAKQIAGVIFRALTDTSSESRGVRRPSSIIELCHIAEATEAEVTSIVEVFRKPERSFLMPPAGVALEPDTFVDISHESLMRVWGRLIEWARLENGSMRVYRRLARTAARYEQGRTGLWRDPDLTIALAWRDSARPTEAWAVRYNPGFAQAMSFLEQSEKERDRIIAETRRSRRRKIQTAWGVSLMLALVAAYALIQEQRAEQQKLRAEQNFQLAVRAVDEMMTDEILEHSLADIPQTENLRRQLLEKGGDFFEMLRADKSADPNLRMETALTQIRLGKIYQYQGQTDKAESAHRAAIQQLDELRSEFPDQLSFQHQLGSAYNWYGEQLRPYDDKGAESAYKSALEIQRHLVEVDPDNRDYRYELARTLNNRGILTSRQPDRRDDTDRIFAEAIELFETLLNEYGDTVYAWRLARTQNNLAIFLRESGRPAEAIDTYNQAIDLIEELVESNPENREYREALAEIYNNLGNLYLVQSNNEAALDATSHSQMLFEGLATPAYGLRNEIANSLNTRGRILSELESNEDAAIAFRGAIDGFRRLAQDSPDLDKDPGLLQRLGNALANFAILRAREERFDDAVRLLSDAIRRYEDAVRASNKAPEYTRSLVDAFWVLANLQLNHGHVDEATQATERLIEQSKNAESLYSAALLYERARQLAASETSMTPAQRSRTEAAYFQRTLDLLQQAVAGGLSYERLQTASSDDFHGISSRSEFQRLLKDARDTQNL